MHGPWGGRFKEEDPWMLRDSLLCGNRAHRCSLVLRSEGYQLLTRKMQLCDIGGVPPCSWEKDSCPLFSLGEEL